MLIDKQSISIIKLLLNSTPDSPRNSFSYDYICELSNLNENDMFRIVKHLVKCGYAETVYSNSPTFGKQARGIALTQFGVRYKEYQKLETIVKWKERIYGFIAGVVSGVSIAYLIKILL